MKTFLKIFTYFALIAVIITASACDNNGTPVVDGDIDPSLITLTLGPIETDDSSSYVRIPLEAFGSTSDDLVGATVDVTVVDGASASGIPADELYHEESVSVIFTVSPVAENDVVQITVNRIDGSSITFEGTIDDDTESLASLAATS
jgi:hypothetical protein